MSDSPSLLAVCQDRYGMQFKRIGGELYAPCPFHADGSRPNFRVNTNKELWHCDVCGVGGDVLAFVMKKENTDFKGAKEKLGLNGHSKGELVEICRYTYTDENGKALFQVVRYLEPSGKKTFRQCHRNASGAEVQNIAGVRRVLYRLPEVLAAERVIVTEGEKDVDNLRALGFIATTNPCGGCNWLDSYSGFLVGKSVVVVVDNDKKGREHAEQVIKSITGKAREVFRLELPGVPEKGDASDFIALHGANAKAELDKLIANLQPLKPEANIPLKSIRELEAEYREFVSRAESKTLNLSTWLPSLYTVRPLVPGELVVALADTGVGKTALLQNLALAARPLPTLMFELELPGSLLFERFAQIVERLPGEDICAAYRKGDSAAKALARLDHVYSCTLSRMNGPELERIINQAELKIGQRPGVVLIDYVGLMAGRGSNRYEKISDVAEQLKVIAKATDTIVVVASQVHRSNQTDGSAEVFLHDAKDSGSIENSAGLVLGAWRSGNGGEVLNLKILKNTKGRAGRTIACNFDGETMTITERA